MVFSLSFDFDTTAPLVLNELPLSENTKMCIICRLCIRVERYGIVDNILFILLLCFFLLPVGSYGLNRYRVVNIGHINTPYKSLADCYYD